MCHPASQWNGYHESNSGQPSGPEVNMLKCPSTWNCYEDWLHVLMVAVPDDQKVPLKLMEDWKIVDFKTQKLVQVSLPLTANVHEDGI